jgi:hypothetical protein
MRVECQDCEFLREVRRDGDRSPADVLMEHVRETGHSVKMESVE